MVSLVHAEGPLATCASGLSTVSYLLYLEHYKWLKFIAG